MPSRTKKSKRVHRRTRRGGNGSSKQSTNIDAILAEIKKMPRPITKLDDLWKFSNLVDRLRSHIVKCKSKNCLDSFYATIHTILNDNRAIAFNGLKAMFGEINDLMKSDLTKVETKKLRTILTKTSEEVIREKSENFILAHSRIESVLRSLERIGRHSSTHRLDLSRFDIDKLIISLKEKHQEIEAELTKRQNIAKESQVKKQSLKQHLTYFKKFADKIKLPDQFLIKKVQHVRTVVENQSTCNELSNIVRRPLLPENENPISCAIFILLGYLSYILYYSGICILMIKGGKAIQFYTGYLTTDIDIIILPIGELTDEKVNEIGKEITKFILYVINVSIEKPILVVKDRPSDTEGSTVKEIDPLIKRIGTASSIIPISIIDYNLHAEKIVQPLSPKRKNMLDDSLQFTRDAISKIKTIIRDEKKSKVREDKETLFQELKDFLEENIGKLPHEIDTKIFLELPSHYTDDSISRLKELSTDMTKVQKQLISMSTITKEDKTEKVKVTPILDIGLGFRHMEPYMQNMYMNIEQHLAIEGEHFLLWIEGLDALLREKLYTIAKYTTNIDSLLSKDKDYLDKSIVLISELIKNSDYEEIVKNIIFSILNDKTMQTYINRKLIRYDLNTYTADQLLIILSKQYYDPDRQLREKLFIPPPPPPSDQTNSSSRSHSKGI